MFVASPNGGSYDNEGHASWNVGWQQCLPFKYSHVSYIFLRQKRSRLQRSRSKAFLIEIRYYVDKTRAATQTSSPVDL